MSIRRVGGGPPAQFAALEQIRSANNRPVDSVKRHLPGQAGEEQRELQEMGLLGNGLNLGYREKKQDPRQQAAAQLRAKLQADAYEETKAPLVDLQGDGAQFEEDSDRTPPTGTRLADLMYGNIAHLDADFRAHEEDLVDEDEEPQGYSQQDSQSEEDGFLAQLDDVGPELDEEEPLLFEPAGDFFAQLEDVPEEPRESLMRTMPLPPVEDSELPFDSGEPVETLGDEDVVEEQLAASAMPWQEAAEPAAATPVAVTPVEATPLESAPLQPWPEPVEAAPSLDTSAPSSAPAATGMLADDWSAFIPLPGEGSKPPVDS
jgi:hypothetical protein